MIPLSDFRSASVSGVIADGAAGIGRKATEKVHQDRRIRRSDGSTGRAGRGGEGVNSGVKDAAQTPLRPLLRDGTDGGCGPVLPS